VSASFIFSFLSEEGVWSIYTAGSNAYNVDMGPNPNKLVVVYASSSEEAGLMKGLLEGAEIPAFISDEFMGTIAPWYITPGGLGAVKVSVFERDRERAEELIEAMRHSGEGFIENVEEE
jgi:hypothetical protein